MATEQEEIRTLYVVGIPYDATERELYLLFAGCDGYERSMIVRKDNKRPYGFVVFHTQHEAEAARTKYDGFVFDAVEGMKIKVELSKRNTPAWFQSREPHEHVPPGYGMPLHQPGPIQGVKRTRSSYNDPREDLPYNGNKHAIKTLHISGFPSTVDKETFASVIEANFPGQVRGMRFNKGAAGSFAFVGFHTPEMALAARDRLNGFEWTFDGVYSSLKASFANSEYEPLGQQVAPAYGASALGQGPARLPPVRAIRQPLPPVKAPGGGSAVRTLHLSRFPQYATKDAVWQWAEGKGALEIEAVQLRNISQQQVAFILFLTPESARAAMAILNGQLFEDAQISASFARSELDPTKIRE